MLLLYTKYYINMYLIVYNIIALTTKNAFKIYDWRNKKSGRVLRIYSSYSYQNFNGLLDGINNFFGIKYFNFQIFR